MHQLHHPVTGIDLGVRIPLRGTGTGVGNPPIGRKQVEKWFFLLYIVHLVEQCMYLFPTDGGIAYTSLRTTPFGGTGGVQ